MISLESDVFALAEAWGWSFDDIVRLSYSRRKRAVEWIRVFAAKSSEAAKSSSDGSVAFSDYDVDRIWGV